MTSSTRQCVIGIKGAKPDPEYPVNLWFDSLKSVASVLSEDNQKLLEMIAQHNPETVTELSSISGRAVSNLSRTIKTFEKHGLIKIEQCGKKLQPKVIYDTLNRHQFSRYSPASFGSVPHTLPVTTDY